MDNYKKFLEDKGYDVSKQWSEFEERVIYRKFIQNEIIVSSGETNTNIYILETGCVRYFTINDGKEFTHDIIEAPSSFASMYGIDPNEVSNVNIQALTDSDIYILQSEDIEYLNNKYPSFREIGARSFSEVAKNRIIQAGKIKMMSPKERYLDFLESRPELANLIPQYIIASYLGITPESLSRIRKRMYKSSGTK